MFITLNWIKDLIDTQANAEEIVNTLNDLGIESEIIIDRNKVLNCFTIATIVKTTPHPTIPKLSICQVQINQQEIVQVICGASNTRENINVVFAPIGSIIPSNGMVIEKRVIKDVESNGMLCSAYELQIGHDSAGILEIEDEVKIGDKLINYHNLGDIIIKLDITPNRGDCFGVYGIARELAARKMGVLKNIDFSPPDMFPQINKENIKIEITNESLVPYFSLWKVNNVKNIKIPKWIIQRLQDVEIKTFNNILDIVSFISHSLGQPLHVYDADKLSGKILVGQCTREAINTNVTAINDKEYNLIEEDIVHVINNKIINISGIIGEKDNGISSDTNNIFIESALFNKENIAQTGQRLNITTNSRTKFERGIDPAMVDVVPIQVIKTVLKYQNNALFTQKICIDHRNTLTQNKTIELQKAKIFKLIGEELSNEVIEQTLHNIGCKVTALDEETYSITIPTWRSDILCQSDIIQEIIRIHGCNKIKEDALQPVPFEKSILEQIKNKIRTILTISGYNEAYTWSFHNKEGTKFATSNQNVIQITNPISSELEYMRNSLVPGLIKLAQYNKARFENIIAAFEIGPVFNHTNIHQSSCESLTVGIMKSGLAQERHLYSDNQSADFFDMKGVVENLLEAFNINLNEVKFVNTNKLSFLHPKRSVKIFLQNNEIGYLGQIHPIISQDYSVYTATIVAQINVMGLMHNQANNTKPYFIPSKYQKVHRDFSFLVDKQVQIGEITNKIYAINEKLIKDVILFDVFISDTLPENKKSFAIQVVLQSDEKTLSEDEIKNMENTIINFIQENFHAQLRC